MTSINQTPGLSQQIQAPKTASAPPPKTQGEAQPSISLTDQVNQTKTNQGSADTVSFVDGSAKAQQIRLLLSQNKIEDIETLVKGMSLSEIRSLGLSQNEIQKIGNGLKASSYIPGVGSYTADEQNVLERLIKYNSELSANQKVFLLDSFGSDETLASYVFSESKMDLSSLSMANKTRLLQTLASSDSWIGELKGAWTELNRSSDRARPEDILASRILKGARNEAELKSLLGKLDQFSRDDVVYHYVMNLPATELRALSEDTKKLLLAKLVDPSISIAGFNFDFNTGNMDELFKMTGEKHAEAAQRVIHYMRQETRESEEVQTLASQSDALMDKLKALETDLNQAIANKTLDSSSIQSFQAAFTKALAEATSQEHKDKIQALKDKLESATLQAEQTNISGDTLKTEIAETEKLVGEIKDTVGPLTQKLDALNKDLAKAQTQVDDHLKTLVAQEREANKLRQTLTQTTDEYTALVGELETLLQNDKPTPTQLKKIQANIEKLKGIEAGFNELQGENQATLTALNNKETEIKVYQDQYNHMVGQFNDTLDQIQDQQGALKGAMGAYSSDIKALEASIKEVETALADAKTQQKTPADKEAIQATETKLSELKGQLTQHKTRLAQANTAANQKLQALETLNTQVSAAADKTQEGRQQVKETLGKVAVAIANPSPANIIAAGAAMAKAFSQMAQEQLDEIRAQLPNISLTKLNEVKSRIAELEAQMTTEEMNASEREALEKEIDSIKVAFANIESNMSIINGQKSQLDQSIDLLIQNTDNAQKELQAATSTLKDAEAVLKQSQDIVQGVRTQIDQLKDQLQTYDGNIEGLETQLKSVQESKAKHKELLANAASNPDFDQKSYIQTLADIESFERAIQTKINTLQGSMNTVSENLSNQLKQLDNYETSLSVQQANINQLQKDVQNKVNTLVDLHAQTQTMMAEQRQKLDSLPQTHHVELALEMEKLESQYFDLSQQLSLAAGTIEQANHENAKSLTTIKEVNTALENIQDTRTSLKEFIDNQYTKTHSSLSQQVEHLENSKAKKNQIVQEFEQFKQALSDGSQQFTFAELQTRLERFKYELPSNMLSEIFTALDELPQAQQTLKTLGALLEGHSYIRADADDFANLLTGKIGEIRADIGSINTQIDSANAALDATQADMQATQRTLLEQRKALGIQSADYQSALQEYEALLNKGGNLTPQELQKLNQLEGHLNQIENTLIQNRSHLSDRLLQLNSLKTEVNQAQDKIREHVKTLNGLKVQLQEKRSKLSESLLELEGGRGQLIEKRAKVEMSIQKLEEAIQKFPGLRDELKPYLDALKAEKAKMDTLLGEMDSEIRKTNDTLTNLGNLGLELDQTIQAALQLQNKLFILQARIDDTIQELESLIAEIDKTLEETQKLQNSVDQSQSASEDSRPSSTPRSESPEDTSKEKFGFNSVKRYFGKSTQATTPAYVANSDRARNEAHEKKREAALKAFQTQLANAREQGLRLREDTANTLQIESRIQNLIQQAHAGQSNASAINIVGLDTIQTANN